ncbi:hypothetical protein ACFQZS_05980 [Mucilaginibacter calamicampi]|uniref:Glycoside hydrolase n=1 Tax=Mucilaginibacter calamicampi TaxID=1302352 RepID=A0ABW2YTC6_9SPHI
MKRKIFVAALLVCCVTVAFAAFADLTGKWKGTLKFGDNEIELNYTFKVDGENLTGSIGTGQGEFPITEGKIKGNDFTFSLDFNGNKIPNVGKYYGDSTIITQDFNGNKSKIKLTRIP